MSMFIEIFVSGLDKPQVVNINHATAFILKVEELGKTTRLGKVV